MAIIHPFKGWLPLTEKADEVACPPYDVISTDEARDLSKGKPDSFLHVIRPEIDLPESTPFNADEVYDKGAQNLNRLLHSDVFLQDDKPSIYIYQLETENHVQTGVFTCASVQDYDTDIILKHELTRPDKEDDRTRHILTQKAHAEPVMLTFDDTADVAFLMDKLIITTPPAIEHTGERGVIHRIWKTNTVSDFVEAFSKIEKLYIADGHHRCKSASRVAEILRKEKSAFPGESEFEYFPVVLFPMNQMKILPYNRVIKHCTEKQFEQLRSLGLIQSDDKEPSSRGFVSIYYNQTWWTMPLPEPSDSTIASSLDVARLQDQVLEPVFGIENPRTDEGIDFIGGIRGTAELEKIVDSGEYELAISMYPTSTKELIDTSDAGELMPPKSTWFEPKIKSGFIVHTF